MKSLEVLEVTFSGNLISGGSLFGFSMSDSRDTLGDDATAGRMKWDGWNKEGLVTFWLDNEGLRLLALTHL